MNLNPFKRLPKQTPQNTYTLPKVCRICFKEIHPYASKCADCAERELEDD